MNIKTYGAGERLAVCEDTLCTYYEGEKLILLPIPTTRDGVCITETDTALEEVAECVTEGVTVVGYAIPDWLIRKIRERGGAVFDCEGDEKFLSDNAELTASGTVGYLLTSEKRELSELSFGIIGYGRIGKCLLRYLLFFGAKVKVFTGKTSSRMELCRLGVESEITAPPLNLSGLDILINTAPATVITNYEIPFLPPDLKIIDLASGNYLKSVPNVIRLPGIPEKYYPRSAGRVYAEAILRFLGGSTK